MTESAAPTPLTFDVNEISKLLPHRYPFMPGVLIVEAMAQAAGVLAFKTVPPAPEGKRQIVYLAGVDEARFKRMVVPGDQLVLEAEVDRIVRNIGKFRCRATVDGQLACEALLMAALQVQ
jgi:3-hydroxyacyl-[acyl-carrier-protein] dehydratase